MAARAELHGELRGRTVSIISEEAHAWASSELGATKAAIRHEAKQARESARSQVFQIRLQCEQHSILWSEAYRRHEKTLAYSMRKAETVYAQVVAAFRSELEAPAPRTSTLEMQAADFDNRRSAMGTKVLELTNAENTLAARCQMLQVHHDGIAEHGSRQCVTSAHDTNEMIARLRKASKTLEAEVGVFRPLET